MTTEEVGDLYEFFSVKSNFKQEVYRKTLESFELLKVEASNVIDDFKDFKEREGHHLDLNYSSIGAYEAELRFSGDALIFQMHTNVFAFPQDHFLHNLPLVKKDSNNGYVGMILIYNFLADSLRFNRITDIGYLLGRIFINNQGHFFVQGRRQFAFLFQDFEKQIFDKKSARNIVQMAMRQAIDFDLYVPPFDHVKEITLHQKNLQQGNTAIKTGKRLGFQYGFSDE